MMCNQSPLDIIYATHILQQAHALVVLYLFLSSASRVEQVLKIILRCYLNMDSLHEDEEEHTGRKKK